MADINDILAGRVAILDGAAHTFAQDLERVLAVLGDSLHQVLDGFDRDGGRFVYNDRDIQLAASMYSELLASLKKAGYRDAVDQYLGRYPDVVKKVLETYKVAQLPAEMTKVSRKVAETARKLDLAFFSAIGEESAREIQRSISQAVLFERDYSSFVKDLRGRITGEASNGIPLKRYANTHANTAIAQFDALVTEQAAKDASVTFFRYWGPLDGATRPWCRQILKNNVPRTKEEIDKLPPSKTNSTGADNFVGRGGYNCRHVWQAVPSDELATLRTEAPTAPEKPAQPKSDGFPSDPAGLEVVKTLGGSTGAMLVRDPATGKQYVRKEGADPGHLREEAAADELYRALGVKVPPSKIYEVAGKPVKLAEFIEGKTLEQLRKEGGGAYHGALSSLSEDFAADVLLSNRDVVGLKFDNVLVGDDGTVWRVDNGGSLRRRAQGAIKDDFNHFVPDLWSLRDRKLNAQTAEAFESLGYREVVAQLERITGAESRARMKTALDRLDGDLAAVVSKRMETLADVAKTGRTLLADDWKPEYTDRFSFHSHGLQQAGITDKFPASLTNKGVEIFDEKGKKFDDLRGKGSTMKAVADYLKAQGGDYASISHWTERQGGSSWSGAAQATKYFLTKNREKDSSASYWWKEGVAVAKAHYEGALIKVKGYDETFTAWHALNFEFARRVDFPKNDRAAGVLELMRTESKDVMALNALKPGDTGLMMRGPAESCSIYARVKVFGSELTVQKVLHHRVMGMYFFERAPESGMSPFLGDGENEVVVLLEGLEVHYKK